MEHLAVLSRRVLEVGGHMSGLLERIEELQEESVDASECISQFEESQMTASVLKQVCSSFLPVNHLSHETPPGRSSADSPSQ